MTDDHVTRLKRLKEKEARLFREKLEKEAQKKTIEDQISAIVSELKALGIEPSELRSKVEELDKQVSAKIVELEAVLDKADAYARG